MPLDSLRTPPWPLVVLLMISPALWRPIAQFRFIDRDRSTADF